MISPSFACPKGQPILPTAQECAENPRARSAKLRFGIRTAHPPIALEPALLGLATLPGASR